MKPSNCLELRELKAKLYDMKKRKAHKMREVERLIESIDRTEREIEVLSKHG